MTALASVYRPDDAHFFGIPLSLGIALVYAFLLKTLCEQTGEGRRIPGDARAELKGTAFGMGTGMVEDLLAGSIVGPGSFQQGADRVWRRRRSFPTPFLDGPPLWAPF
ncbi:MAG: hypothetical protein MZU95_03945 [Desulfomicrobium escambiense]|nr:hypothetical protein [Desulfomicrobium escambiense]